MKKTLQCVFAIASLLIGAATVQAEDLVIGDNTATTMFNTAIIEQSDMANPDYMMAYKKSSYGKRNNNKFAIGAHFTTCGSGKMGAGLKFGYNFTDILRFAITGDYYFNGPNKYKTMTKTGEISEHLYERLWDINPELNFVFGDGNFHFYLVTGITFAYGHSKLESIFDDALDDIYGQGKNVTIGGKEYFESDNSYYDYTTDEYYYKIDEDKPDPIYAVGLNLGCGIEYQITPAFRMSLEQTASITLPLSQIAWTWRLGAHYCF